MNESRNHTRQRLYAGTVQNNSASKLEKPLKSLKRPPIFPATIKNTSPPRNEKVEEYEEYMRSPVFKRLQERNTSAFFNYMTASVSKCHALSEVLIILFLCATVTDNVV